MQKIREQHIDRIVRFIRDMAGRRRIAYQEYYRKADGHFNAKTNKLWSSVFNLKNRRMKTEDQMRLPALFLMSVLSKTFLTLMRCHLMSFSFLTAWHV
jgi:hypothetical protein